MAKDPVCGMEVNESDARKEKLTSTFGDREYFFCSAECKTDFDQNPASYAETMMEEKGKMRKGMAKQIKPAKAKAPMASAKAQPHKKQKK